MNENNIGKEILDKLLSSNFEFIDEKGELIEVPAKGNLGLLAIGYKGVVAVRKKRNHQKSES